jgi:hypothetical protein
MNKAESDIGQFYIHHFFAFVFSIAFGIIPLLIHLNDAEINVRHFNKPVENTILNILPFVLIGFVSFILFILMLLYYRQISVNEDYITIQKWNKNEKIPWSEISSILKLNLSNKHKYFKIKTTSGKTFLTVSDYPKTHFLGMFSEDTEMEKLITKYYSKR